MLQHRDELSRFIGEEISRTMAEQREMEREYERLIEQRAELKGMVNKNRYKDVQERVHEISRGLRESTSKLVASLKENPNVSGNMIKVDRDRREALDLFLRLNLELREKGTFFALSQRVDEEDASIAKLQHLQARDRELTDGIAKMEASLRSENEVFQRTSKERKEMIISLKEEIHRFKGNTSNSTHFKKRESLAKVSSTARDFKLSERVLEQRIQELDAQHRTEQTVNNETRSFLVRKQQSLLDEGGRWDARFEAETSDRDRALKAVMQQRAVMLGHLTALQERRKGEEEAERLASELAAAAADMERHRREVAQKKMAAASRIYNLLMTVVARSRAASGNDSKKKKKKGDGKKKK